MHLLGLNAQGRNKVGAKHLEKKMSYRSLKLKKALSAFPGADLTPFTFAPWLQDLLEALL